MGDGKAHAKLSASGAHRWLNCPGSVRMEAGIDRPSSSYAAEGTAAHAFAEACLQKGYDADQLIGETFEGYEATLEMAEYVQEYLDYVRSIEGNLVIEQRVDFSPWAPGGFGTADAIILNDGTVHVVDLKYGENKRVDANENHQAMIYGLGVINDFGALFDIKKLVLTIVQPRMDSISEYTVSKEDLLAWGVKVVEAAQAALGEDAPLIPGEDQCCFCAAKHQCSARASEKFQAINADFEGFDTPDDLGERRVAGELTPKQLSRILPHLVGIADWAKEIKGHAADLAEKGERIPGYKLVLSSPHRAWREEEAASKALVRKLTKKKAYPEKLISVSQAEKVLGKEHRLIKDYAYKPEGKPTIAPESDKREAITTNIADGFGVLDEAA